MKRSLPRTTILGSLIALMLTMACSSEERDANERPNAGDSATGGEGGAREPQLPGNGTGGRASATANLRGKVLDQLGKPWKGTRIAVGGQTVRTAEDGSFELEGVEGSYDLSARADDLRLVYHWIGLTKRELEVRLPRMDFPIVSTVELSATLKTEPSASAAWISLQVRCAAGERLSFGDRKTEFSATLHRHSAETTSCVLVGYERERSGLLPIYVEHFELDETTTSLHFDIELKDVPSSTYEVEFERQEGDVPILRAEWAPYSWDSAISIPYQVLESTEKLVRAQVPWPPTPGITALFSVSPVQNRGTMRLQNLWSSEQNTKATYELRVDQRVRERPLKEPLALARDALFEAEPLDTEGYYRFEYLFKGSQTQIWIQTREAHVQVPDLSSVGIKELTGPGTWWLSFVHGGDFEDLNPWGTNSLIHSRTVGGIQFKEE